MKTRFILMVSLLLVGFSAETRAQTMPPAPAKATALATHKYCLMKDGKMMIVEGGRLRPMTENMTMRDGTLCMTDGTCKRTDGTIIHMKEGEHMMMSGKMMRNPSFKKRP